MRYKLVRHLPKYIIWWLFAEPYLRQIPTNHVQTDLLLIDLLFDLLPIVRPVLPSGVDGFSLIKLFPVKGWINCGSVYSYKNLSFVMSQKVYCWLWYISRRDEKCQRRRNKNEKPGQKWGIKKTTLVDDQVRATVEVMAEKSHSHKGCMSTLGTRQPVPEFRQKMVLCSHLEYPICVCVYSYFILPCRCHFGKMA